MPQSASLSTEQLNEARVICDEICERLEVDTEYTYDLSERRGKAGSFPDEVRERAIGLLRAVGCHASRTGSVVLVRKR